MLKNLPLKASKTQEAIEQQRALLEEQLSVQAEKKSSDCWKFESNMADVINHYLFAAIGNEIDLSSQMDYIFKILKKKIKRQLSQILNLGSKHYGIDAPDSHC